MRKLLVEVPRKGGVGLDQVSVEVVRQGWILGAF